MGRNQKIKGIYNWKSRNYINRRTEYKIKKAYENKLRKYLEILGISKIENHFLSNGKLKMIISSTTNSSLANFINFSSKSKGNELNQEKKIVQYLFNFLLHNLKTNEVVKINNEFPAAVLTRSAGDKIRNINEQTEGNKKINAFISKETNINSSFFPLRGLEEGNKSNPPFESLFPPLGGLVEGRGNIIELIFQEVFYNYLDPYILAKSIAEIKNKKGLTNFPRRGLGEGNFNFWSEFGNKNNYLQSLGEKFERNETTPFENTQSSVSQCINGIRIEIKGITGKMTMSKKIIKTFGTLKFNSSDSIIDFGEAKNFNKKGIIGVKVWISYKEVK